MNRRLLIILAVVSATLMLFLSMLTNLASTYIAETLKPYAVWIFAALGLVFAASLGVLIWQLRAEQKGGGSGPSVRQRAVRGGRIKHSPVQVPNAPGVSVVQSAEDQGEIDRSPVIIEDTSDASVWQTATDKGKIKNSGVTID